MIILECTFERSHLIALASNPVPFQIRYYQENECLQSVLELINSPLSIEMVEKILLEKTPVV